MRARCGKCLRLHDLTLACPAKRRQSKPFKRRATEKYSPPPPITSAPERFGGIGLHGFKCASCQDTRPPEIIAEWYWFVKGIAGRVNVAVNCRGCGNGFQLTGSPRSLS